jgi:hypothetical protein
MVELVTNISKIEIEIITSCNVLCFNCDRSSTQAPSTERMTVGQIAHFVDESIELGWQWKTISLMGGEPTLHRELPAIVGEIGRYREFCPSVEVRIKTNGVHSDHVRRMLSGMPSWVLMRSSEKQGRVYLFSAYNVAPRDLSEYQGADFRQGCWITRHVGMGLTRYGYYPCGAGASVDRVFGLDIGIQRLKDVTAERLSAQLEQLCALCGHFKEVMSSSWQKAYESYRIAAPRLSVYGSPAESGVRQPSSASV